MLCYTEEDIIHFLGGTMISTHALSTEQFSINPDLVSRLKAEHPRFQSLYEKHLQLDKEIMNKEGPSGAGYNERVVKLKKEKLRLKDEMQKIIQQSKSN